MKFDIITIFPKIFSAQGGSVSGGDSYGYFGASIIKRAVKNSLIKINVHNLRDFTRDKHRTTDDTPYGGGAGMVMKVEPIFDSVKFVKSLKPMKSKKMKTRVILFSAKGKKYTQSDAKRLAKYDNLILICGRYEGVDERVAEYIADEEISIGEYVLTGGEIPAMVLADSITRLLPGVLGNPDSLNEESFGTIKNYPPKTDQASVKKLKIKNSILEYPQYTKPEEYAGWKVPKVLLSGDHKKIKNWRKENSKKD
jgi:tRNA (guanine37-N1)-methyltransferase